MIVTTMTTSTTALPSLARAALSASTSLSPAAPTGVCCLAMPRRGQLRSGGGHDDNDDHTGVNRTILVCAQCDVGYRLDAEDDFVLENGVVVGECGESCSAWWHAAMPSTPGHLHAVLDAVLSIPHAANRSRKGDLGHHDA